MDRPLSGAGAVTDIKTTDAGVWRAWRRRVVPALFYATMPALTVLNAGVGLLLPMLLEPVAFGQYALVVTLFQYGLIFDLGLSQLTDRLVPRMLGIEHANTLAGFRQQVLWTRLYLAVLLLAGGSAGALLINHRSAEFPAGSAWLSLVAGVAFMVLMGPTSFYRAASDRRTFWRVSVAINLILAVARPVGLISGGIMGCFAMLGLAYAALAGQLQAGMPLDWTARPGVRASFGLLGRGLPLFLTSFAWAFYLTANRWVISGAATDIELGHFAFGSNVVTLIVGAAGALGQFYYPRIVTRAATAGPYGVSASVRRDFCRLAAASGVVTGVGMVLGPTLIGLLYPKFLPSIPVVQPMLLAVPSLVVASWLMPLSLSTALRPWREGVIVYPTALAVLVAATWTGYRVNGIAGAGWGLVASALPLLALQLGTLSVAALLRTRDAAQIIAVSTGVTGLVSLLLL